MEHTVVHSLDGRLHAIDIAAHHSCDGLVDIHTSQSAFVAEHTEDGLGDIHTADTEFVDVRSADCHGCMELPASEHGFRDDDGAQRETFFFLFLFLIVDL